MSDWRIKAKGVHELVPKEYKPYSTRDRGLLAEKLSGKAVHLALIVHGKGKASPAGGSSREQLHQALADVRVYLELLSAAFAVDLDAACSARLRLILSEKWPEFLDHLASLPEDQFECVCQRLCDGCVRADRENGKVLSAEEAQEDWWVHPVRGGGSFGACFAGELRKRRTLVVGDDSGGVLEVDAREEGEEK